MHATHIRKPLYTNEQLFDMNDPAMRKARADAAEEIYRHSMMGETGDLDWLCRLQHESRINIKKRIDVQGRKLNFSMPNVVEQEGYREFSMLTNTAFELTQEVGQTMNRLNELYPDGDEFQKFQTELGELPHAINMIHDSLSEQKRLLCGEASLDPAEVDTKMERIVMGQTTVQHFADQQVHNVSASDFAGNNALNTIFKIHEQMFVSDRLDEPPQVVQQVNALREEYISDPEKISAQIESGVLEQRIELYKLGKLDDKVPVQLNILDAKTAERQMNPLKGNAGMEV